MSDGEVLFMEDVYKSYPSGVRALQGVTLRVRRGDVLGLVGPNGSGKSTLIKVALGVSSRDRGVVLLNGLDPFRDPRAREGVGVVFERPSLPSGMSVRDFLRMAARIYGSPPEAADEALALAGLSGHEDKQFNHLSAGLKQRAAIAHALVSQPDVLVADEPTSNLDPVERLRILDLLGELNARGMTILVSSHVIYEVMRVSTRIAVMRRGVVVAEGPAAEVIRRSVKVRVRAGRLDVASEVLERAGFKVDNMQHSLLVHVGGDTGRFFRAIAEAEAAGAEVYAIDMVEPGFSEVLTGG